MVLEQGHPAFALSQFLASPNIHCTEVEGALEEFAFRSLLINKRVRDWCKDLTDVLEQVSQLTANCLHLNVGSVSRQLTGPFVLRASPPISDIVWPRRLSTRFIPSLTSLTILTFP